MQHGDLLGGQLQAAVEFDDARVVPHRDLAQEDVGEQGAVELHRAGGDAGDVDDRHDAADHGGELGEAELGEFFGFHRGVGRAEVDGAGLDLGDAAAGADGLVVHFLGGGGGVVGGPLRHDRVDERGACAGDVGGIGGGREAAGQDERQGEGGGAEALELGHGRNSSSGCAHSITIR